MTCIAAHDNPFRATRIEALTFEPQGTTWEALLARLESLGYRGAIVGPHGSGKTTLLLQLQSRLARRGLEPVLLFRNSDGPGALPAHWRAALTDLASRQVLLVDGYDCLHAPARAQLLLHARRSAGVVVTSHRPIILPTLHRTRTSPQLLQTLVNHLKADDSRDAAASAEIERLYRRHRGNIRDALHELYERSAIASG